MFRRAKIALVAAVAAIGLTAVPTSAGAALGPCRTVPTETGVGGWQFVAIAGAYTAPAGATGAELTCNVVVDGRIYASASDEVPGPVAALAGTGQIPTNAGFLTCYTLRVTYLTQSSTTTNTCP